MSVAGLKRSIDPILSSFSLQPPRMYKLSPRASNGAKARGSSMDGKVVQVLAVVENRSTLRSAAQLDLWLVIGLLQPPATYMSLPSPATDAKHLGLDMCGNCSHSHASKSKHSVTSRAVEQSCPPRMYQRPCTLALQACERAVDNGGSKRHEEESGKKQYAERVDVRPSEVPVQTQTAPLLMAASKGLLAS
mmetsp:Transcript_33403/g.95968  ORF Transcript_33403/g.95968 Transcript_33403/m.95968 type:complete len:191 (+) Transcript_33403:497-1069(+)